MEFVKGVSMPNYKIKIGADPDAQFKKMTTESVPKLIISMAIPAIISQIISSLYSLADTYFVSSIGTSATAAPGVAFPLLLIIQTISLMLAVGSGSLAGRQLGQKNLDGANRTISTAFFISVIIGTIIGIFSLIFLEPIMVLCGATPTILPYAYDYAFWIILATPFYSATFVLAHVVRQEGNVKLATIGTVAGAIVNVVLDPIFIFTFKLGIVGAAIATSLSQMVSFTILFSHIAGNRCVLKLRWRYFHPDKETITEIVKVGSPNLFQSSLLVIAQIMLNNAAGIYGDAALAGMNIVNRVSHLLILSIMGFGQGFQPMCGYNYGAKMYKRVKEGLWFTIKSGLLIITSLATITFIFSPFIIGLFNSTKDPDVIVIGTKILRANLIIMPFVTVTTASNMLFLSCGKAFKAAILALARNGIVFIPMIILLPKLFGLDGVILTQPVADAFTFIIGLFMLANELGKLNKLQSIHDAMPVQAGGEK
ncbi:MAG: MATE family efflux transporter [Sphaerochaetaceae bacterium]